MIDEQPPRIQVNALIAERILERDDVVDLEGDGAVGARSLEHACDVLRGDGVAALGLAVLPRISEIGDERRHTRCTVALEGRHKEQKLEQLVIGTRFWTTMQALDDIGMPASYAHQRARLVFPVFEATFFMRIQRLAQITRHLPAKAGSIIESKHTHIFILSQLGAIALRQIKSLRFSRIQDQTFGSATDTPGTTKMTASRIPSVQEEVAFLSRPDAYLHRPGTVDVKETHMSWVFLAAGLVYKLKKPVSYPFLDFTTLEARRVNCLEEVRLNARLAEGVYLGVVALRSTEAGELSLGPIGQIIDWLVCMRRLPADRMLDDLIAAAAVDCVGVNRAAAKLMSFYKAALPLEVSSEWVRARFFSEHLEDARLLSDDRFNLDRGRTERVLKLMRSALDSIGPYLQQRAEAKAYLEGHGDLRPEHVCLVTEPVFIDCLEFNRDLRILDPFDEIAYLGLECERLGAAWVGDVFLSSARQTLLSHPPEVLLCFYRAARSLLRARLALAHLTEPHPRTPEKWEPRARQYLRIAERSLQALNAYIDL